MVECCKIGKLDARLARLPNTSPLLWCIVRGKVFSSRLLGSILILRLLRKVSNLSPTEDGGWKRRTGRETREDREVEMDPVTVAATSRADRSRVIFLQVRTQASALTHFARCLVVRSGWESTRFILVKWYINKTARFNRYKTHVFRACGDSLICPLFKGMMLPMSRCDTWAKILRETLIETTYHLVDAISTGSDVRSGCLSSVSTI